MSIPENHVVAEGRNLKAAVEAAAAQLGVSPSLVEHKLDLAHFRNAAGTGVGMDTVRIFAWAKNLADVEPAMDAEAWMKGLLGAMGRTGSVSAENRGGTVLVRVDVGEAGRHLVGRGGATLKAVQYLLEVALAGKHRGIHWRIDVARGEEDRGRGDDRPRRDDDRPRRDDDRRARGRDDRPRDDRPRGDRPRDDRPRRDDDRRENGGRREREVEELKKLARKLARMALDQGEPVQVRRELNSFDRRIIHLEVAEIEGVASRSVGDGLDRRLEIFPIDALPGSGSEEG